MVLNKLLSARTLVLGKFHGQTLYHLSKVRDLNAKAGLQSVPLPDNEAAATFAGIEISWIRPSQLVLSGNEWGGTPSTVCILLGRRLLQIFCKITSGTLGAAKSCRW